MMAQQQKLNVPSGTKTPPMMKKSTGSYEQASAATSSPNWKSSQYMPGIATEIESEWMEKLYEKFKEIDILKGEIQRTMNDLEKDHLSQRQALNESFDAMIESLNQRRQTLINQMSEDVSSYKASLSTKLKQLSSDRNDLKKTKKSYEENVDNSKFTDIEKRESMNVDLIKNVLTQVGVVNPLKAKHPKFEINQLDISSLGQFKLEREIPQSPSVFILFRTAENCLIEVLMDEKYKNDKVQSYELCIYKGPLDEKEAENVKENEYLKVDISVCCADNICFYRINDLDDSESYNIRIRAILKNEGIKGQYSKWIAFETKALGWDDDEDGDEVVFEKGDVEYLERIWHKNVENANLRKIGVSEFEAWLLVFKRVEIGLTEYQQKRMFFCMQQVEEGPGYKVEAADFANFVLSVGQRFESIEWKTMCQTIRERLMEFKQ